MALRLEARKKTRQGDITPLIDVVFLLLIFFLLTSSFVFKSFDLRLPAKAKVKPQVTENLPPVTITLTASGDVLFDGVPVDVRDLRRNVYAHIPASGKRAFVLRTEDTVPVQQFVAVMDQIRAAGATDVRVARSGTGAG